MREAIPSLHVQTRSRTSRREGSVAFWNARAVVTARTRLLVTQKNQNPASATRPPPPRFILKLGL